MRLPWTVRKSEWWLVGLTLAAAIILASVTGCAAIGGDRVPRNTSEAILEAKAIAKAYTLSIESLANRCVQGVPPNCQKYAISRSQALAQLDRVSEVERDLRAAAQIVQLGGDGGDTILLRVNNTLALVLTFLAAQETE